MELKKFNELQHGQTYLVDKNKFTTDGKRFIYIGKFLPLNSIKNIEDNTKDQLHEILSSFDTQVEAQENGIYISPITLEEINKRKFNKNNIITKQESLTEVYISTNKIEIFNHLSNLSNIFREPNLHYDYYKDIENILMIDLSNVIEEYKRKNPDKLIENDGVYNPILESQLDKVQDYINYMIDNFSEIQKEILLKDPYRNGWGIIHNNAQQYLYKKYHKKEFEVIAYNNAIQSLQETLLHFDKLLGGQGANIKSMIDTIRDFLDNTMNYIKSIKFKPQNDQEIEEIIEDLAINSISKFVDFLNENLESRNIEFINEINSHILNIYESLRIIIALKNYEYKNIDTLSALGLYKQLNEYYNQKDFENILFTLHTLSTCSVEELSQLSSEHKAKLLSIIVEHEDDSNLQRTSNTLLPLCEDKEYIERLMNDALEGEKYQLASLLRDINNNKK